MHARLKVVALLCCTHTALACAHAGPGSLGARKKAKVAASAPAALPTLAAADEPEKRKSRIQESDFAATPVTDQDLAPTPPSPPPTPTADGVAHPAAPAATTAEGAPAPAAAPPAEASSTPTAPPPVGESPAADSAAKDEEGQVSADVNKGGVTLGFDKKLDSDKIRKAWAARGGTLGGYEATIGATLMSYNKDGIDMSGKGFAFGLRLQETSFTAPSYETQDTSWTATRFGIGIDGSKMTVTSSGYGSSMSVSETSMTLNAFLGFSLALGSFTSETEWSGLMVGVDWAPGMTFVTTPSMTVAGYTIPSSTSHSTNLKAFSINFESGSLQALAESMASEAHLKIRILFLPPVGDLPQLITVSVGIVDY